jgi:hypothetical protein
MREIIIRSPGKKWNRGVLKTVRNVMGVRIGALAVLTALFGATAIAQCGGSFSKMAAAAVSIQSESKLSQSSMRNESFSVNDAAKDNPLNPSIVGLWHIRFVVGDTTIQEAFQVWNESGTEVHNPNVDPRTGSVCLGAWKETAVQTFKLTHRVWSYDGAGNFLGTISLNETLTLGDRGSTHAGTFTLDFYDPDGNFQFEVPGTVVGERIAVK